MKKYLPYIFGVLCGVLLISTAHASEPSPRQVLLEYMQAANKVAGDRAAASTAKAGDDKDTAIMMSTFELTKVCTHLWVMASQTNGTVYSVAKKALKDEEQAVVVTAICYAYLDGQTDDPE